MDKCLLHIEQLPGEQMNLKMKGDPATLAKMIANVMKYRQDIAAAFIACVIEYSAKEGFDCGELKKMVKYK
jgi:hypothetical protein